MANIEKINPIGLDAIIHKIGNIVYPLNEKWNIQLTGYPRCEILQNEQGKKTIEFFIENEDYSRSLIFSEGNKFFFVTPEREDGSEENKGYFETQIELYFILNVKECYPNILHRADQEVRFDVQDVLINLSEIKSISVESNIDKVFNRYNNRISQGYEYEYSDFMQPYHAFKVLITLKPYHYKTLYCQIK